MTNSSDDTKPTPEQLAEQERQSTDVYLRTHGWKRDKILADEWTHAQSSARFTEEKAAHKQMLIDVVKLAYVLEHAKGDEREYLADLLSELVLFSFAELLENKDFVLALAIKLSKTLDEDADTRAAICAFRDRILELKP